MEEKKGRKGRSELTGIAKSKDKSKNGKKKKKKLPSKRILPIGSRPSTGMAGRGRTAREASTFARQKAHAATASPARIGTYLPGYGVLYHSLKK